VIRAFIVLALMMATSPSEACTFVPSQVSPHMVDPAEASDTVAPAIADVVGTYHRNEPEGCKEPEGSLCEGYAMVSINIDASDDRTPVAKLGYMISIVPGGDVPDGMRASWNDPSPVLDNANHDLYWFVSYDDEDFAFDIEVQVVDLNGNVSEPKRVHIENGSGGCSTTRSDWTVVPVLALLLRRRRRR
jgi:hypothetical protein